VEKVRIVMSDSRIEKLLKAILGQEVQLEPRESRVERLLYAILTGGSHDEPTLSEMEDILLCILHGERYDGPTNSRINALLKVKANGGSYDEPRLSRIEELIYEWINGGDISTYMGTLPATLQTVAGFLAGYKIWGNPTGCGERTSNLVDISTAEKGRIDNGEVAYASATTALSVSDGTISFTTDANYRGVCCGFVEIPTGTESLTLSGNFVGKDGIGKKLVFYDSQKTWLNADVSISVAQSTPTVTIPTSAKYVRLSFTGQRASSYAIKNLRLNIGSTALLYEPYGYKLPILSNDTTTDIFIGNTQLAKDEYVDSETGQIYRYVDGTLTPTDPPAPLPLIPTAAGETTISYGGTGAQPEKVELKYRK